MELREIVQELWALAIAYAVANQIAPDTDSIATVGAYLALDVARLAKRIEADMVEANVQADERERYAPSMTVEPIPVLSRYEWTNSGGIAKREPVNEVVTDDPDVSMLTPADVENVAAMLGEFFGAVEAVTLNEPADMPMPDPAT